MKMDTYLESTIGCDRREQRYAHSQSVLPQMRYRIDGLMFLLLELLIARKPVYCPELMASLKKFEMPPPSPSNRLSAFDFKKFEMP